MSPKTTIPPISGWAFSLNGEPIGFVPEPCKTSYDTESVIAYNTVLPTEITLEASYSEELKELFSYKTPDNFPLEVSLPKPIRRHKKKRINKKWNKKYGVKYREDIFHIYQIDKAEINDKIDQIILYGISEKF